MAPAHIFALFWSQCLSGSVRGVSWDLTLTNLFLVIVRSAIRRTRRPEIRIEDPEGKRKPLETIVLHADTTCVNLNYPKLPTPSTHKSNIYSG